MRLLGATNLQVISGLLPLEIQKREVPIRRIAHQESRRRPVPSIQVAIRNPKQAFIIGHTGIEQAVRV